MKKTKADFNRLIAELKADMQLLDDLESKHHRANKKISEIQPDEFDWASLGYTIHNIYNLLENYFLRTAKFFENVLDPHQRHRDLVHRMTLEIDGVRPALFSRQLEARIDDLRAFRHLFRNIYQSELDVEKLQLLNGRVPQTINEFKKSHGEFLQKPESITEALDE
jgi:hypothetical protein